MNHYTTLCDVGYLPRALAMFESLRKVEEDAHLYLLAMDEEAYGKLNSAGIPGIHPVRLSDLLGSDSEFAKAKDNRTWQEFCWTCASYFTRWVMERYKPFLLTYLDADMMFYQSPEVIYREIGPASIGIIPHRLIPSKRHLEVNGKYNVSWVTFRNSNHGKECLNTWAKQCLEWCYYRNENGKFGDQKYLDEWPPKYADQCRVIRNIGAGVAPWNLSQYALTKDPILKVNGVPIIFYHFHEFAETEPDVFRYTFYDLRPEDVEHVYQPYVEAYRRNRDLVRSLKC